MRKVMKAFGLAEWGFDELAIATLACGALSAGLCVGAGYFAPGLPALRWISLLPLIPWLIVLQFFRDPDRTAPDGDPATRMLSPADGTVTDITEMDEPSYLGTRAVRVGIFLSPFNVHVNRVPCTGMTMHVKFKAGEFLPAYDPQAPTRNESLELGLLTPQGMKVMVKQITGVLARRIICDAHEGQVYQSGERYGMIKFGSRTELYVPLEAGYQVKVQVGDKVVGGQTVLSVKQN